MVKPKTIFFLVEVLIAILLVYRFFIPVTNGLMGKYYPLDAVSLFGFQLIFIGCMYVAAMLVTLLIKFFWVSAKAEDIMQKKYNQFFKKYREEYTNSYKALWRKI